MAHAAWCAALMLTAVALAAAGPRYSSRIVDTESGAIRGVIVEPASRRLEPVEVFRGVPYAARPARLARPPPPPRWTGTRLADAFAPVCPQRYPDLYNRTAALNNMPLARYNELKSLVPMLANQSEDCLYLNIYVPGSGARGVEAPYAVLTWLGGGSFEWGTANVIDGAVLAAHAHLIIVTVNYRLGLLGFLTPGGSGAEATAVRAAGGAGALDAAAALRWLRRNVAAFGGDPARVALAGHDAGAALATVLLMMPQVKGLFSRVLLMSGTALSSWALAPDPALLRAATVQQLHCQSENVTSSLSDTLTACVRARPLASLLAVTPPAARFLPGWAPSAPAARAPAGAVNALDRSPVFLECALAVGVATTESYDDFSAADIQYGFEEDYRNRILRTYVRNVYTYHRNEIFAAVRNEYTDWDKPIQHPINIRDATLEALSDAATAAPALRVAHLHARRGAQTHFFHFAYQTKDSDYPQRLGSVRGEALPYLLGLPLVGGLPLAPHNYSRQDVAVAETMLALLAAFVKTGDPSAAQETPAYPDYDRATYHGPQWPAYDLVTQQYLSIGSKPRVRSHYRGHKMALWLHLVPQLHRPGAAAPRHHHFREREPNFYSGPIFPERYWAVSALEEGEAEEGASSEECEPPPRPALAEEVSPPDQEANLLKTLTETHYYSYTLALGVTVAVGCFLLALNIIIFAGIYYQRGRSRIKRRQRGSGIRSSNQREAYQSSKAVESGEGSISQIKPIRTKHSTLPRQRSETAEFTIEQSSVGEGPNTLPTKKRVQIQEISV